MISKQVFFNFSPFKAIYDMVIPKDNLPRQINEFIDYSFVREELNIVSITVAMQ